MSFNTPILLLTFTRLDTTKKVFETIKEQKPKYLFWASDGPRLGRPDDLERIEEVKKYVLEQIDWPCEVKTLFREQNLGCGLGVSTAITWFFENVELGIILEDDCVPLPGFFEFCEEMLHYYKDDEHIYEITGTNLQASNTRGDGSYYFSNYGSIWGWATWARAWKSYDFSMSGFDQFVKEKRIMEILPGKKQQDFWIKAFRDGKTVDTWDYQWVFTVWNNNGICIVPNNNFIENIGFDSEGTHTLNEPKWYKKLAIHNNYKAFSIKHPTRIKACQKADDFLFLKTMDITFIDKLMSFIKRKLKIITY